MFRVAITLASFAVMGCSVFAQTPAPPFGGPSGSTIGGTMPTHPKTPPTFGASAGTEIMRHRDFTGKPCLQVAGSARAHTTNANLYDHVIIVLNSCPQRIAMQVCYYKSYYCIPIEVPGNEQKEAILGTMPSTKDFQFEFREKF